MNTHQTLHQPLHQPQGALYAFIAAGLFITALIVLGQSIGWPGILRQPPSVVLPTIEAHRMAALAGYAAYLLSSLALIAVAFALRDRLLAAGAPDSAVNALTFFGAAGGILKTLGIVRWLSVMPLLSAEYAAATTPEARTAIELAYLTINGYAGAVGELLGVQLVSGIWMAGISWLLIRHVRARWLGGLGMLSGIGFLIVAGRVFEPSLAALQAAINPLALLWVISLAVVMLRRGRAASGDPMMANANIR
jgi:Domain of unknown function (DUF4386)